MFFLIFLKEIIWQVEHLSCTMLIREDRILKKLYIEKIASDYIQHVLPDILRQHQKAPHFKWQQHVMEISEKSPSQ